MAGLSTPDSNPLSSWDQVAPRAYMRQVYCFPYHNPVDHDLKLLHERLRVALDKACAEDPCFEGDVSTPDSNGRITLHPSTEGNSAVLKVEDVSDSFLSDYASLRKRGFPADAFVGSAFDIPLHPTRPDGQQLLHVVELRARIIRGGLLLCIFVHHSVTDGIGLHKFVASLARHTRLHTNGHINGVSSKPQPPLLAHTELPVSATEKLLQRHSYTELVQKCRAYWDRPDKTGPLAGRPNPSKESWDGIAKTGRIFVFSGDTIASLKQLVAANGSPSTPSTFAIIVALTWIFVINNRVPLPGVAPPTDQTCGLVIPVSWARRAYTNLIRERDGNTVAMIKVDTERDHLLAAADLQATRLQPKAAAAYAHLVRLVEAGLNEIDQEFVNIHAAMLRAVPDFRRVCINHDPLCQNDFIMNSWRHFGADTQWGFHNVTGNQAEGATMGDDGIRPDAVRRGQAEWNMSAALILPGRKDTRDYEVIVTLDTDSMKGLCADERWMTWVERVIE